MSMIKTVLAAAVVLAGVSAASAQTAAPAPAATTPAPAAKAAAPAATAAAPKATAGAKKASTPEGIECSAQADAKNLHGAERKKFRNACIKQMKAAAKASGKAAAPAATAPAATAPAAKKN